MPDIRVAVQVAAGATNQNILAGNTFEFVGQRPTAVQVFAVEDGVAETEGALDVNFGNAIVAQGLAIPVFTATLGPDTDKHMVTQGIAMPGDRLVIAAKNVAAAAAMNLRALIRLTTVA
jgi:hypothetical protein